VSSLWNAIVQFEHRVERFFGFHPGPDPVDDEPPAALPASPAGPGGAGQSVYTPPSQPGVSFPAGTASSTSDDAIVGPAFRWLSREDLGWTADARRALLDLQRAVGLDPKVGGLLAVIDHESGGDPAAPRQATGLPRGGLFQVTAGANVPGYTTADAVWAIRSQSAADQIRGVGRALYTRMFSHGAGNTQDAVALLRRNFLPSEADKDADYVLGVRDAAKAPHGEDAADKIAGLTRGAIYRANFGFDPGAKLDPASKQIVGGRGFFTWADVDVHAHAAIARGKKAGGWLTVSGRLVPFDVPLAGAAGSDPHAMLAAWRNGTADPIRWEPIDLGSGFQGYTTGEPLSIGGWAHVLPYEDLVQIAADAGALPLTRQISDARWRAATDRRIVPPVPSPVGALYNDAAQIATFNASRGPIGTTGIRDGDHKEMIVIEGDQDPPHNKQKMQPSGPNSMVFYGWRKPDGSTWQKGIRSDHDRRWIEYDSLGSLVARYATKGGRLIDLLDVLAAGGPLGGPLAAWQVAELRGSRPFAMARSTYAGTSSGALAALSTGLAVAGVE
jgi:hypothetical protein